MLDADAPAASHLRLHLGDESLDVGRRRPVEGALPFPPHKRQRVADGADHLGLRRHDDLEPHGAATACRRARTTADGNEHGLREALIVHDGGHEVAHGLRRCLEHAAGHLLGRQPERLPRKIERGERGGAIAGGVVVRLDDPEGVGGTGVGQRDARPSRNRTTR